MTNSGILYSFIDITVYYTEFIFHFDGLHHNHAPYHFCHINYCIHVQIGNYLYSFEDKYVGVSLEMMDWGRYEKVVNEFYAYSI